jgi:hypothetical protein
LKRKTISIKLPEGVHEAHVIEFEDSDRNELLKIHTSWRELSNSLLSINARAVNLPEGLSESSFCLAMNMVRVIKVSSGANSSFDAYDVSRKLRIQIKACSVLPDLTSFGPRSVWDELYFLDFYKNGSYLGDFDIYKIPNDLIYIHKVNRTQTFLEQQKQGRRPRFSLYREIIQEKNIKPIKTFNLNIND